MAHMQRMVGCTMAGGWRKAIDQHLGKAQGCTHIRELLLFNMATAAFQGMERGRAEAAPRRNAGLPRHLHRLGHPGPVVAREFPLLYRPLAKP